MLKLNKEYTYKQICEELGWNVFTGGDSKKAQIKEIESAYKFYHPENKKTHKPKKSYIFTEMIRETVQPSVKNNGGIRNTKNIDPMMDYIRAIFTRDKCLEQPFTMTELLCDILELMNRESYVMAYKDEPEMDDYCLNHYIQSTKLFKDYSSHLKKVLKDIVLKSIEVLSKKNLAEYEDGYIFYYQISQPEETKNIIGRIFSAQVNAEIKENETLRCNNLNDKYFLSNKMTGRQLLMMIYRSKELITEFDKEKINTLMKDENVIKKLNTEIEEIYTNVYYTIDEGNPLLSYYRAVSINAIEDLTLSESEIKSLARKICHIVINKGRKTFFQNKNNQKIWLLRNICCSRKNCGKDWSTKMVTMIWLFWIRMVNLNCPRKNIISVGLETHQTTENATNSLFETDSSCLET